MSNIEKEGIHIINDIVKRWTLLYKYHITFISKKGDEYKFKCEFGLPTPEKPIPIHTVKVYFTLKVDPKKKDPDIEFRFENNCLIHRPDKTVSNHLMEKWIERFMNDKSHTREVLFLGTEFEATRIKDERIDKVIQSMKYEKKIIDYKRLSEELLSHPKELFIKDDVIDDEFQIETMRKVMFDLFRSYDKDDMGIVSYDELKEILKRLEIEVSEEEFLGLVEQMDKNQNGIIEYREWIPIGAEIVFSWFLKSQTEAAITVKEEEFLFEAVMILYNDEVHAISKAVLESCKKLDEEDDIGTITIEQFSELLAKHSEYLTENEREMIIKIAKKKYNKNIPYEHIPDLILSFKLRVVKHGLMESNLNKMDLYLRDLFKKYENNKAGFIHVNDLGTALRSSEMIVLSNVQIYMIQTFLDKDENGLIDYMSSCKFIGELIKRFFSPTMLDKKAKLLKHGEIRLNELMEGWTEESIAKELRAAWETFDEDKNNVLDKKEFRKLLKSTKIKISEDEIDYMMKLSDKNNDGVIDMEEFINCFYDILKITRCHSAIESLSKI